ncbi:MAG: GerMN domain-containing protein [bacterium]
MKKITIFLGGIIILILAGAVIFVFLTSGGDGKGINKYLPSTFSSTSEENKIIRLYFASPAGIFLVSEDRELASWPAYVTEQAKEIIEELIKGPRIELIPTLPETTKIRETYFHKGILYLDMSGEMVKDHLKGTGGEWLTIFSIVNSIMTNLPSISGVQILVEGRPITTLAGHIDATQPFKSDFSLIRERGREE